MAHENVLSYALQRASPCKTDLRFVHVAHAIAGDMAIHRLYGELAASLVSATTDRCDPGPQPARAGAKLDGSGGLSAFEDALTTLRNLGLATPEDKLAIDADRVAQVVARRSRIGQVTAFLDRVLSPPIVRAVAKRRRLP